MDEYSELCLDTFLAHQGQLFDEPVAETQEEAEAFLEDCLAQVFPDFKAVKAYMEEAGLDISGMDDDEIAGQAEIFPIPDGTYLVVEG